MKKILTTGPALVIGIPTLGRPVPFQWAMSFKQLNPPINFNVSMQVIHGLPVAEARNAIIKHALAIEAKYVFFLGDDTEAPPHTLRQLLYRIENTPDIGAVGGVYCSKSIPPAPLVFRGNGQGSYWDWKIGEFFEVTGLGNDCTLFKTEIFKHVSEPWFKTVDTDQYIDGIPSAEQWTEDLYFFNKLAKETSYKIYCDAAVICNHWDVYTNTAYGLPLESKPLRAMVGSGKQKCLIFGQLKNPEGYDCCTIGLEEDDWNPDYRGTQTNTPFDNDFFDRIVIRAGFDESTHAELKRILKPGGEITMVTHGNN